MSRTITPLSDSAYRSAKPTDRAYKLFNGDSLYLLVQPNGRKGLTSFGNYPVAGLANARNKRQISSTAAELPKIGVSTQTIHRRRKDRAKRCRRQQPR